MAFICQQCKQPLRIVEGSNLPTAVHKRGDSITTGRSVSSGSGTDGDVEAAGAEALLFDGELMGMLNAPSVASISTSLAYAAKLFELTAAETEIDHPLCRDCVQVVMRKLDAQVHEAESEYDTYRRHLSDLEHAPAVSTHMSPEQFEAELKQAQQAEETLKAELRAIENERAKLREERAQLFAERAELDVLEQRYWRDFNDFQLQLSSYESERDAVQRSIERYTEQLNTLRSTNVLNDSFFIFHDGPFGTINGLRLGRLPNVQVEWPEVNAAWGLAALLLHLLGKRYQHSFETYRVLPMGSFTKVCRIGDERAACELFYTNEGGFGKLLRSGSFDKAMHIFLLCLADFGRYVMSKDTSFKLPYPLENDRISGISIKAYHEGEKWTKALKYMLTDLKFLLVWAAENPPSGG